MVRLLDPLTDAELWNAEAARSPSASVFHSAEWAKVLARAYSYRPAYLAMLGGGERALLPVFEVASCLSGRRGVSVPFSDSCNVLCADSAGQAPAVLAMAEIGRRLNWEYLELRGPQLESPSARPVQEFVEHTLSLESTEPALLERFHDAHRRNIRKATRHGVEIDTLETRDAIEQYYRLHCMTRKRLGVPPQPLRFFHLIHQHLIARGMGVVLLARHDNRYIAGGVCLHFGRNAIYKFAASDAACQHLRPNNLVLWEAIRYYLAAGSKTLSLGRTGLSDEGLRRFKSGWGATESALAYRRIPIRDSSASSPRRFFQSVGPKILRRMPIPVLRTVGALVYRHLG